MFYLLLIIALYALSAFWLAVASPWLDAQYADQARWQKEQEELRKPKPKPKHEIGKFERFIFPIIRRASPALIAPNIVSVQPMTGPVGGIAFYKARYGEKEEELRTVLDDIVDALIASETDPEWIAEEIVREVFKDHPYSTYNPNYIPELEPAAASVFAGVEG